ncbi:MAG: hypothetical protein KC518_05085 [Candidatus Cloacimonetes bacterium]|nr:hypothetical protein [Candidatus Cloacimonadota bacterium]
MVPQTALNLRWLAPWVLALLALGCASHVERRLLPPAGLAGLHGQDGSRPELKAHLVNGDLLLFDSWQLDSLDTWLLGQGVHYDASRRVLQHGSLAVPVSRVVLCETAHITPADKGGPLIGMSVVTGILGLVCAVNPKACFGSCPTVYAPDAQGRMVLMAECFSSSVAPALEASDLDMLLNARANTRDIRLQLTNEAQETHVIRRLDLLALPRPTDGRTYATGEGVFVQGLEARPASVALAPEGDCTELLARADGQERFGPADPHDLAAREWLELQFDEVPEGPLGLVLVGRQTLLTTFLFYQALAWLGDEAGSWLASLDSGGPDACARAGAVGDLLGSIEVQVLDMAGAWIPVGSVGETGPIAADTELVPLPDTVQRPLRVRLLQTRGLWRLDQAALVRLGDPVMPVRLSPVAVKQDGRPDADALDRLRDPERVLISLPGDCRQLQYALPQDPASFELFLDARGYYLEWMREEWLAEQDLRKAARLARDPAACLRELAPEFKKLEPLMEEDFWSSRYVIQP